MENVVLIKETKQEPPEEDGGLEGAWGEAAGGGEGGGGAGGEVGRLVESSQAEDRRLIRLVRARRLLYARNNMPVASYYALCKQQWQEVADHMGRSVGEVRRKWSHIRNSYSRHLRNETAGARTGRGRAVSRWYLADELAFLRAHMATDTRSPSWGRYGEAGGAEAAAGGGAAVAADGGGEAAAAGGAWGGWALEPKVEAVYGSEDGGSLAEDEGSFLAFFRGLQADWQALGARRRRRFLRHCLAQLHALLDEQEASPPRSPAPTPAVAPASPPHAHDSILPNS